MRHSNSVKYSGDWSAQQVKHWNDLMVDSYIKPENELPVLARKYRWLSKFIWFILLPSEKLSRELCENKDHYQRRNWCNTLTQDLSTEFTAAIWLFKSLTCLTASATVTGNYYTATHSNKKISWCWIFNTTLVLWNGKTFLCTATTVFQLFTHCRK